MLEPKQVCLHGADARCFDVVPLPLDEGSKREGAVEVVPNHKHGANGSCAKLDADQGLFFLIGSHRHSAEVQIIEWGASYQTQPLPGSIRNGPGAGP
jgi:hypothetical protein